jgi:D-alanyl-lipoteichoic acid acyltransferase DltB (MBOAT superfamily)
MAPSTTDRTATISIRQFALLGVELGLLLLVVRQFQLESPSFLRLTIVAVLGFGIHAWLPLRHRLPFFVALSLAAIVMILGVANGAWLVAAGLVLIGICHLPVRMPVRVAVLVVTGAALALVRAEWVQLPWPAVVWPILGSMFMFRVVVYLYDLAHDRAPVSFTRTLAYFFLLPNVCFPLFPVVDYKTFRRQYYDGDAYRIYQVGIDWMARGVVQLILYRIVYYYFTLAPSEIGGPATLGQYIVATFLLYLRVSGQFHIIIGMCHLFGFNLPETHHRYYLASSFTDFWRRINIYWKDFMLKVFYYPLYFKLRRWGTTLALVVSTLAVFLCTWLLHSYQWFWLRGSFPVLWQDGMFWGILALLVVVNALYETHRGRHRTLGRQTSDLRRSAMHGLRTAGTFVVIAVLWSLWTSESLSTWASLWKVVDARSIMTAAAISLAVGVMAVAGASVRTAAAPLPSERPMWGAWSHPTVVTIASLAVLGLLGLQPVYGRLGSSAASVIHSLRSGGLSRVDTALLERGYYEDLIRVDRFNSQLWEVYMNKPLNWLDAFEASGLERFTGDFIQKELGPSFRSLTRHGMITTNRWGMRDRDYERQPAPGTFRIAALGPSTVMGWGVGDDETFENVLEARLNRERPEGAFARYEILNFGVPNYSPLQQLGILDKVLSFQPRAVFYVGTRNEVLQASRYLAEVTRKGITIPDAGLRAIAERAGLARGLDETTALRQLEPYRLDVLSTTYTEIARRSRDAGVTPVWIFIPHQADKAPADAARAAAAAGFTVLSLEGYYGDRDPATLRLAEWDDHPNTMAHRLIADELYRLLMAQVPHLLTRDDNRTAGTR